MLKSSDLFESREYSKFAAENIKILPLVVFKCSDYDLNHRLINFGYAAYLLLDFLSDDVLKISAQMKTQSRHSFSVL